MTMTTRSAIAFSVSGRYLTLALQFVSTMLLARLLTPEDIGIYSAGFSIIALAHLFRDFGLNQYIIQEKELTENKIQTTFTISLIIAWSLGSAVYLIAGPAEDFFNEKGIKQLLHLLSINFFIIPFGSITLALLRKNLRFHVTASIGFIATLLGILVAVWSAYDGARYFCLAYGAITETSCIVVLSTFFRPKGTKIRLSLQKAKSIFRFGSIVGLGNIVTQLSTSATDALIAKFLGLSALGFFSRAFGTYSLFENIFVSSIRPTILPLLSRDNNSLERLTEGYLKAMSYSFVFAWPFFAFLFLYTDEVIRALYGSQWDAAIPLVKILCAAGIILPPILFANNLFVAFGKPDIALKVQLISNITKLLLVFIAIFQGLEAVCMALLGYFFVRLISVIYYTKKVLNIDFLSILTLCRQTLPCLFTMILPTIMAGQLMKGNVENIYFHFFILTTTAAIGWLFGLGISNHPFYEEIRIIFRRFAPNKSTL